MQKLTISLSNAPTVIAGLVAQGLTFEARETDCDTIVITFTGGF